MEIKTDLDNAKRFYYQRKTCFRGMLRYNKNGKFNIPFGKYKSINYNELLNKDYKIDVLKYNLASFSTMYPWKRVIIKIQLDTDYNSDKIRLDLENFVKEDGGDQQPSPADTSFFTFSPSTINNG